jgi:hypothetical protein
MVKEIKRRGQITLWVIIAIVFVASIVVFFLIEINPTLNGSKEFNVKESLDGCVVDSTNEVLKIILPRGGFVNETNYIEWNNNKVTYLCQNRGNYKTCINQHPAYLEEISHEIEGYILPRVEECLINLKEDAEKRSISLEYTAPLINVDLAPNRVYVNTESEINTEENGQTKTYAEFKTEIISPIYNLANVAIEISNQEAKYCYFEYVGYSILYPQFQISKQALSEGTKIYTIEDVKSGNELNIAVRSCAIPPGF